VFIAHYASGENFQGDHLDEGDPSDSVNISCFIIFLILYIVLCGLWTGYVIFVSIPTENHKLLSTPLKIVPKGLVYILSYLDDGGPRDRISDSLSVINKSITNVRNFKMKRELSTSVSKITKIIGRAYHEEKSTIKYLSESSLREAVDTFKEHGHVVNPRWEVYDMEKKLTLIASTRKLNFEKRASRRSKFEMEHSKIKSASP